MHYSKSVRYQRVPGLQIRYICNHKSKGGWAYLWCWDHLVVIRWWRATSRTMAPGLLTGVVALINPQKRHRLNFYTAFGDRARKFWTSYRCPPAVYTGTFNLLIYPLTVFPVPSLHSLKLMYDFSASVQPMLQLPLSSTFVSINESPWPINKYYLNDVSCCRAKINNFQCADLASTKLFLSVLAPSPVLREVIVRLVLN